MNLLLNLLSNNAELNKKERDWLLPFKIITVSLFMPPELPLQRKYTHYI